MFTFLDVDLTPLKQVLACGNVFDGSRSEILQV